VRDRARVSLEDFRRRAALNQRILAFEPETHTPYKWISGRTMARDVSIRRTGSARAVRDQRAYDNALREMRALPCRRARRRRPGAGHQRTGGATAAVRRRLPFAPSLARGVAWANRDGALGTEATAKLNMRRNILVTTN